MVTCACRGRDKKRIQALVEGILGKAILRKIVLGVFRTIMVNLNVARTLLISNFTNYLIGVPP